MPQNSQKLSIALLFIISFFTYNLELWACVEDPLEDPHPAGMALIITNPPSQIMERLGVQAAIRTDVAEVGRFYWSQGLYENALPYILITALGWGDPTAWRQMAECFEHGLVVKSGFKVSQDMISKLIHYGILSYSQDGQGPSSAGRCLRRVNFGQNHDIAIRIYEGLMARGLTGVRISLGNLYVRIGNQKYAADDIENAYEFFLKAYEMGNAHAAFMLGSMFHRGELIEPPSDETTDEDRRRENLLEAKEYLSEASRRGHTEAQALLVHLEKELSSLSSPVREARTCSALPPTPSMVPPEDLTASPTHSPTPPTHSHNDEGSDSEDKELVGIWGR